MVLIKANRQEPSKQNIVDVFMRYDKVDGFLYVHYFGSFADYPEGRLK